MPIVKAKVEAKESKLPMPAEEPRQSSRSRDVSMAPGDVTIDELEAGEVRVKDETFTLKKSKKTFLSVWMERQ